MKIWTTILTAGAILALVVPAAGATVLGPGSITHTTASAAVKADRQTAQLKAQIKALEAELRALKATRSALVKGNGALAYDNRSLGKQVNDLWAKVRELENVIDPPVPQVLTAHDECVYSGNNCTAEELCTIWGYGGCDVPVPVDGTTAQIESPEAAPAGR